MPDLALNALTFFEEMEASSVFEERAIALDNLIKGHGFQYWAVMLQRDPFSPTPYAMENFHFIDRRNEQWAHEYHSCKLASIDPTWSASPQFLLPQFWDDIPQTDAQKRHMDRAAIDGGATNGISGIAAAPGGGGAGFSVSGRDKRAKGAIALQIFSAVQIFRIFAQAEMAAETTARYKLSANDLKILRLYWEGYDRAQISIMVGRTVGALNQRFKEIREQFGVAKDISVIRLLLQAGVLP
ncbi:autoinducer binding domain-containing protein [Parvibaculaceae bacterium PLY_AMNH_Bact1]|nr:autoinducer binding domain-containing protein [Parvibaculaceae bacterium PLY_AMNH_Bact1]